MQELNSAADVVQESNKNAEGTDLSYTNVGSLSILYIQLFLVAIVYFFFIPNTAFKSIAVIRSIL